MLSNPLIFLREASLLVEWKLFDTTKAMYWIFCTLRYFSGYICPTPGLVTSIGSQCRSSVKLLAQGKCVRTRPTGFLNSFYHRPGSWAKAIFENEMHLCYGAENNWACKWKLIDSYQICTASFHCGLELSVHGLLQV